MKKPTKAPNAILAHAGEVLYGENWRMPLARALGVNDDTIRRWMQGVTVLQITHAVFGKLDALLERRQEEIADELTTVRMQIGATIRATVGRPRK